MPYDELMDNDASQPLHPTAQKLVDTVIEMLQTTTYKNIKSENVLLRSGISRGPLYHHFANFDDLIETAQAQIFRNYSSMLIGELNRVLDVCSDPADAQRQFMQYLKSTATTPSIAILNQRIGIIYNASFVPPLRDKLAESEEALTQSWIRTFERFEARGWTERLVDPRGLAILMQATFIGRVLDSLSNTQMDPVIWCHTIFNLVQNFFFRLVPIARSEMQL